MANRQATVFYSWQSDSPNATNRGLIGTALETAVKAVRDDDSIKVDPVVDRDTKGVAGSPDIADTIFSKIEAAEAFVADVSIINPKAPGRPTPNPNVLVELGYAIKVLGWSRIILVVNTAFGEREVLPFDLRGRRTAAYCAEPTAEDRATPRRELATQLTDALRLILDRPRESVREHFKPILDDDSKRVEAADIVDAEVLRVRGTLEAENLNTAWSPDELLTRIRRYEEVVAPLVDLFALAGQWASSAHGGLWHSALERVANPAAPGNYMEVWQRLRLYVPLRLLYAGGIAAMREGHWVFLKRLLVDTEVAHQGERFPAAFLLHSPDTFGSDLEKLLPGMGNRRSPLSDHLSSTLREPLREHLATEEEYNRTFNRFEAFVALVHVDTRPEGLWGWAPLGRLPWKDRNIFDQIGKEAGRSPDDWPPLKAGLFNGSWQRFSRAFTAAKEMLGRTPSW